jgi:hypothetical protein
MAMLVLRAHRKQQAEERLAWGPGYVDGDLVFARENGEPTHPERFSDVFERTVRRLGLPRVRLHDLRHGAATAAIRAGVPLPVVSKMLGHSSIAITADVYGHIDGAMMADAAARVAAAIAAGTVPADAYCRPPSGACRVPYAPGVPSTTSRSGGGCSTYPGGTGATGPCLGGGTTTVRPGRR